MSIADALNEVKIKISDVYTKCSEKGATLPDIQNLENLPATIDSVKSGGIEVVQAYYNDTDIEAGKKVFLTNVGYTVTGSDTFSPEVRVSFISENGYAGDVAYNGNPIYVSNSRKNVYDILNGSVDSSTGRATYTGSSSFYFGYRIIPFFLNNGAVFIEGNSTVDYYGLQRDNAYTVVCYNYNTVKKSGSIGSTFGMNVLETGFFSCSTRKICKIDNDLNETLYDTGMPGQRTTYVIEDDECYYFYKDTASYRKTWTLAKGQAAEGALTVTDIKTDTYEEALPFTFVHSEENNNPHILLQCKQRITTDKGFMRFIVHALGYMCFDINNEDETQSVISTHGWSESSLAETIGNRTIYKMQTFYDGTFSLDLSDGTTLICEFTPLKTVNCLEVVEPFVIEGDTTVYHRTFSETRMYWYQRPEGTAKQMSTTKGANAPISSKPYGPYNATRAVTNYLAVDPLDSRFNSTVLTGFLTGQVDTIEGREIVGVKTATKGTTVIDYSDVVNCYVSGVTLGQPELNSTGTELEPSSVCDVDVLLTKVGYQLTGSSTLSPNIRLYCISENGWVLDDTQNRYDIVNGVVDASTKFDHTNGVYSVKHLPLYFRNGNVYGFLSTTTMTITNASTGYMDTYSYENSKRITVWSSNMNTRTFFLDFGYATSLNGCALVLINDDVSTKGISLNSLTSDIYNKGRCFVSGVESKFWVLSTQSDGTTGKLIQFVKNGDTYVPTLLATQAINTSALSMSQGSIFLASKQLISTDTGFVTHTLHQNGYIKFDVNTQNSSESIVTFNAYPQAILDFIGNRTVYKIQTFYDGTFSLDLSDGTTLMCGFIGDNYEPVIQEVIEPFIIEGDTNVYHINFSERKMYWIQAHSPLAPLSSNPWGAYNATKATVDWLAVPRVQNRWNTTVLTGVIRQSAQLAKPVFDDTGRRVLQVETTIKKNNCNDNATYEWTLEDYNKVVDKQG